MARKSSKSTSSAEAATAVAVAAATKSLGKSKASKSSVGAPSQHKQTTRKGKKAWRKNIDIEDVEQGLEEMRSEERVIGTALQNLKDSDLFAVDVKGDDKIRHITPKFSSSQLTSAKILAQRSAVPAVFSRPTSSGKRKAGALSREEKERLLKIAKRQRKGPFGAVLDPSELQSGEGAVELSAAVKESGSFDPWSTKDDDDMEVDVGLETVKPRKVKPPPTTKPKDKIEVAAVAEPHQGTSYNPPVEAHTELIYKAAEIEKRKIEELERMAETRKKMDAAKLEDGVVYENGVPAGMTVDVPDAEGSEQDEEERPVDAAAVKRQPKPKTKQQRAKAARMLAEKRALAAATARKKQLAIIEQAKGLRRANARQMTAQERAAEEKRLQMQLKLKQAGLAGQKLGKHKVPEAPVEVQIGEDLSENLRGLKPEGNLFRDRFMSLQQRALIEPRVRVLPKRRTHKIVEYEKHAWKKFDRE